MEIIIENVKIILTDDQESLIIKERNKRKRSRNSFARMLKHFGFKEVPDIKNSYVHRSTNWYADIFNIGKYDQVWMTGQGLKDSGSFPGGWIYSTPKEIEQELLKHKI